MKVRRIVVHHTASPDNVFSYDWNTIRRYHTEVNGWSDIGYHFGIERVDGQFRTHVGRRPWEVGAHVKNQNTGSLGIAIVGNFSIAPPPLDLVDYAASIVGWLVHTYGLSASDVFGHRELAATECPGTKFPLAEFKLYVVNWVTKLRTSLTLT
jgi:N-acetylmuramoyl-L-alanine amidase